MHNINNKHAQYKYISEIINTQRNINYTENIESTYLLNKDSPTNCKCRTFHPTIDTIVLSLNSRSPSSQGYESSRTGPRSTLTHTTNYQALTVFPTTQKSYFTISLPLHPTQPK
jgi:hypothetical protein